MQIEREMSAVNREVTFERELQLPAQRFGHRTQARPKHPMMDDEQVGAAFRALLQCAAGDIHCRRNFLYLARILQLQAVERILVILNFAEPQIRIAITDDVVQSRDRKSTRLNSSHVSISYAVFCLKKKNSNTYFDAIC